MIEKLYNLKKNQTDLKLMEKSQLESKVDKIDAEIMLTMNSINTATVDRYGAISDFALLTIHKNTMKMHIKELEKEKKILLFNIDNISKNIVELQKESEQFKYILEEEKKEKLRKILVAEEEAANEYVQSKYITS